MRKSRAEKSGKIQIHNIILNFPALDFLVQKIKEREIQKNFCRSLPYFSIYPGHYEQTANLLNTCTSVTLHLFYVCNCMALKWKEFTIMTFFGKEV